MELETGISGRTDVAIRDLDNGRLEAAVKLWERTEPNDALAFSLAEVLAAVVARMPALVALADDARVVRAIAARVDGERAWVLRWSVESDARRRGIGASLLRALERRLLALGVREISMLAPRDSLGADTARAAGYTLHEDNAYLEKRQLHTTAGGQLSPGQTRRYHEDVDWIYHQAGAVLSPQAVAAQVAKLRRARVAF